MKVLSFLHQKGGTGKSTLAICSAIGLARQGKRVLLLDADYQGTSSDWGNRFGPDFSVETRSQVQPILHKDLDRFKNSVDIVVVDGPPSLSEMTESILLASDRVLLPLRPAWPDVWALPWLAAMHAKLRKQGAAPMTALVFNQVQAEDLAPLIAELDNWRLPLSPVHIEADAAFREVFSGKPLPSLQSVRIDALLEWALVGEWKV